MDYLDSIGIYRPRDVEIKVERYKMFRYYILLACILLLSACATMNSLPQSANQVDFSLGKEGKTGWSEYQDISLFKGVDTRTAYLAAKSGLADAGFTIKRADFNELFALGSHGMTAYDWNIVAGVYIKPAEHGSWVKVIVEGSKDIGFWGDMTASSWTQDILKGAREYILTESLIDNPNKKHFE